MPLFWTNIDVGKSVQGAIKVEDCYACAVPAAALAFPVKALEGYLPFADIICA
jgi:hypothetical protein